MENYMLTHSGVDLDVATNIYRGGNTMYFNPLSRYKYYKSVSFTVTNWFTNSDLASHDGLYYLKIMLTRPQETPYDLSDIYIDVIKDNGENVTFDFAIQTTGTGSQTQDAIKIYSNVKFSGNVYVGRTSSIGTERPEIVISLQSPS